jgi:pimeloyl-ACP methyl ester carboxylesterase
MSKLTNADILCFLFILLTPPVLPGAPNAHEQELVEALVLRLERGEAVWLNAGGDHFPAFYHQPLQETAQGAALILHGMGAHADWPEVISPLRLNLPAGGWATLSLQLPVLEPGRPLNAYGNTVSRAADRIRAAVKHLRDRNTTNIVIIGHGFGANTGAHFLAEGGAGIQAFIGIGMQDYDFLYPRQEWSAFLARIKIPILDILGSRDSSEVLQMAADRLREAEKRNPQPYQQIVIDGADRYFAGLEQILIARILDWLAQVAPGATDAESMNQTEAVIPEQTEPTPAP